MKKFKNFMMIAVLALGVALPVAGLATVDTTFAQNALDAACEDDPGSSICENTSGGAELGDVVKTIVNILLYIIGAVSVIMIVIGGLRYALSGGDSSAVSSAKNTILYAVIGLVIAIFSYAIVNWVLEQV